MNGKFSETGSAIFRRGILSLCLVVFMCAPSRAVDSYDLDRDLRIQDFSKEVVRLNVFDEASSDKWAAAHGGQRSRLSPSLSEDADIIGGEEEPRLAPDDKIKIAFSEMGQLNRAVYRIDKDGRIHLPLAGAVAVGGLSVSQGRDAIDKALSGYIYAPQTQVEMDRSGRFMVLGAVDRPGVFEFQDNFTVMEGLLLSQYNTRTAKLKNVIVIRGSKKKQTVFKLNLYKMIAQGDRTDNIFLKPGDLVLVPTGVVANIQTYLQNFYRGVLIWYGLGGQDIIKKGEPFVGPVN